MKRKYLPLYKAWCATGKLPSGNGLCYEFSRYSLAEGKRLYEPLFALVRPIRTSKAYWGFEGISTNAEAPWKFTPIRQNLVLLMAAMNGEL